MQNLGLEITVLFRNLQPLYEPCQWMVLAGAKVYAY